MIKIFLSVIVQLPVIHQVYRYFYKKRVRAALSCAKLPKSAHIETYNLCDGGCVMCYYRQMTRMKEIMPMDLFKKIVDDLKANGFERISPDFYSDPFFDPYIFERIEYAKKIGLAVHMFTNASLLNKERVDKLLECPPDSMVVSLDAANAETDKKIRPGLDLDIIKKNLKYLIEARNQKNLKEPKITTVFVLQDVNLNEVDEYKKEWEGVADKVDVNMDNLSVREMPKIFNHPFPCVRLFSLFVVMSSGKVALCSNDFDGKYAVGDFNKQTFQEIISSPAFQLYRDVHKDFKSDLIKICKDCAYSYDINSWKWWKT